MDVGEPGRHGSFRATLWRMWASGGCESGPEGLQCLPSHTTLTLFLLLSHLIAWGFHHLPHFS